jgi:hypothetical protein
MEGQSLSWLLLHHHLFGLSVVNIEKTGDLHEKG